MWEVFETLNTNENTKSHLKHRNFFLFFRAGFISLSAATAGESDCECLKIKSTSVSIISFITFLKFSSLDEVLKIV